jgi:hypothetical protein
MLFHPFTPKGGTGKIAGKIAGKRGNLPRSTYPALKMHAMSLFAASNEVEKSDIWREAGKSNSLKRLRGL